MTAPLFILAQAHESTNPIWQISNEFGLRLPLLIAQIVNFVVVATILWYFAFKPILATIKERQEKIEAGLKYSEEMRAKLEAAQQTCDAQIREAQVKARDLMTEVQKTAKEFAEKQQKEATDRANGLIEKAQAAIDLEKRKMLTEARAEIARLVIATTQQVLAQQLTDADRSRYNAAAERELAKL